MQRPKKYQSELKWRKREGRLVKGGSFWVEYRGEKLPIDFIFGTPIKREIHGFPVYTTVKVGHPSHLQFRWVFTVPLFRNE